MENEIRSSKVAAIAPFAIAVAEAHGVRADWLGKVKEVRRRSRTITHDEYSVVHAAYVKAKHKLREAVAEYQRAQSEYRNGGTPKLKPEWREWLRMFCGMEF